MPYPDTKKRKAPGIPDPRAAGVGIIEDTPITPPPPIAQPVPTTNRTGIDIGGPPVDPITRGITGPPGQPAINATAQPGMVGGMPRSELPVHMGVETKGLSKLGKLIERRRALQDADVSSKVTDTDWGTEVGPPEQSPSRMRQVLMGALQGAIIGGQHGAWSALGAAGTGAAAGGASPRLMQALSRKQETDRTTGDIETELGIQSAQSGIAQQQAQTRRLGYPPGEPQYKQDQTGAYHTVWGGRSEPVIGPEGDPLVGRDPDAETEAQRRTREDRNTQSDANRKNQREMNEARIKQRQESENRQQARQDRINQTQNAKKKAKLTEAQAKEKEWTSYDQRSQDYADQAARIQLEVDDEGRIKDPAAKSRKDSLEAASVQAAKDAATARAALDRAQAEADAIPDSEESEGTGKTFNLKAWTKDHPGTDTAAKRKQYTDKGYTIIE